ncbi:MFS transporter [Kytococcus sp. Marseille-QA3725]
MGPLLTLVAVATVALMLRPAATSVGPLLPELSGDLGGGGVGAGVLTALPPLIFGVLGLAAVPVARRLGLGGALVASLAVSLVGLALRPLVGSMGIFLALSVLALMGGALGNVLVPAWVKHHSSGTLLRRLMAVHVAVLSLGGSAGALLAVPLTGLPHVVGPWLGQGSEGPSGGVWRTSLLAWAVITLLPLVLWVVVARRTGHDFPRETAVLDTPPVSIWRSPTAVALTVMFALQSTNAYTQFGWLPRIYTDAGVSPGMAGLYSAVVAACGILGGWIMPSLIERAPSLPTLAALCGVITTVGYLGLLVAPQSLALLWALVLGVGGFAFPMVIALLPARTADPAITARLSGVVQPVGYIGAAVGPLLVGGVVALTGSTSVVLWILVGIGVLLGIASWRAARETLVDEELAAARWVSPGGGRR